MKTMKSYLGTFAAVSLLLVTGAVSAAPIQGAVTFGGDWSPMNAAGDTIVPIASAAHIAFVGAIEVEQAIGDLAGAAGSQATYTNFTFNPFSGPIAPLWTIEVAGVTFSFDLESISVGLQTSTQLALSGMGTVRAAGFDDTAFSWTFSGDTAGGLLFFSAAGESQQVPEPSIIGLLGLGLIAMGAVGVRRRSAARKA